MRPSAEVRAVKGLEGPRGLSIVRETGTEGAGRPVVESRTCVVIGSRGGAVAELDMVKGVTTDQCKMQCNACASVISYPALSVGNLCSRYEAAVEI